MVSSSDPFPCSRALPASASKGSRSRSTPATWIPAASSARVIALPMPPAAPVTIATLLVSAIAGSSLVARTYLTSDLKEGRVGAAVICSKQNSLRENNDNALGERFLVLATYTPALDASACSISPDCRGRARRCRRPDQLALFRRAGLGFTPRRRTGRDRDGLRATLPARSTPLWLATSEILDAFAYERGFRGQGRRAEHAVRNP